MKYIFPRGLHSGDTLGIVAPSSALADDSIESGLAFLHSLGYTTKCYPSVYAADGYLAGSDAVRANDINAAFADDEVAGIVCLRGGYGATRLLPLLDYDRIGAHPKLFIGFSDITALHTVLQQRCHMATIHGAMVMSLGRAPTPYTIAQFTQGLADPWHTGVPDLPPSCTLETIVPGDVSGPLCGGNLMLLSVTTGTTYGLDGSDGILLLEEIGEEAYSLDRMLRQLEQSGLIDRVQGILFGEFTKCMPVEAQPYEFTVKDVVTQYARRWGKPALWGFPAGHGRDNAWLPLGQNVHLHLTRHQADVIIQ
ncbi:MAG: LD-carboxypeptidase [Megasphaera sp.]|jgi:muramoyltetrapeptide carboxypeptidase|nr:LD-carboxypeptidase [Megasphaera sp.]MCH4187155.1 LD-carboxypeptidase [Megasphaera sp.]MCH4217429.1 LD-carboxypeptidase [Megasphaera sp.]